MNRSVRWMIRDEKRRIYSLSVSYQKIDARLCSQAGKCTDEIFEPHEFDEEDYIDWYKMQ